MYLTFQKVYGTICSERGGTAKHKGNTKQKMNGGIDYYAGMDFG